MRTTMPEPILDFGRSVDSALQRAGGIGLARDAEADYAAADLALKALSQVGMYDIDPRDDLDSAAAAAELCRVAGAQAAPCPVVGIILRDPADKPFALVSDECPIIDHAAAAPLWRAATLSGDVYEARVVQRTGSNLSPFAMKVGLTRLDDEPASPQDVQLALALSAFQLLGTGQQALELAIKHTREREQFGRPLSGFQVIRHSVADLSVGLEGLALLCRFALWQIFTGSSDALPDALAAKHEAQRVVRNVLRMSQQFHGAAGLADEYDISVLARHAQPALRLPTDMTTTLGHLRAAIEERGFEGLYAPEHAHRAALTTGEAR
ncbi:Acyl-CoA dehydrogenase, C-terminal domain [Thermomonospora echinospora]|uniref:Acyl-CoA dehydrogenase, C-terminal domain n=1 Tax=Thermomonospora echinospora TaxID=1992 RepID=A0A1H6AKW5_9ACTN|nr:acyl-CoA dehydrogenase family protein [Thermomonospora echinospora]SEG49338.1 Acyl-CoA dehydrogenase, C-terminal domain [Thermomonospora echinospora]